MIKAAILLNQSRRDWKDLDCVWRYSGKKYQFPELIDSRDQAECYLVIAGVSKATLEELGFAQENEDFDPNKPVIWIDYPRKLVDIFGTTSLLMAEIQEAEYKKERGIRRLIDHLRRSSVLNVR